MAPISNLRPSIKAQCSNRGGEPSAHRSPALLCSHVSGNEPIRGHTLPISGTDERLEADCLNRSSWWLSAGFGCSAGHKGVPREGCRVESPDGSRQRKQRGSIVHSCKIRNVRGLKVVSVPSNLACTDKVPVSKAFNHQTPKWSQQTMEVVFSSSLELCELKPTGNMQKKWKKLI